MEAWIAPVDHFENDVDRSALSCVLVTRKEER
jgi:hypothetical protein